MARIEALSMLTEASGKAYLAELYGKVVDGVMKTLVSAGMKNVNLSGNPTAGTVEVKRFVNATPQEYGTARTSGKGNAVKAATVTVAIDQHKEIVEELEQVDVSLLGVDGVLDLRAKNHILRMGSALDTAFFATAADAAVEVEMDLANGEIQDILETIIQECENTQNDFVDGVPRSMMRLVLNSEYYGRARNYLDKVTRPGMDAAAEEFYAFHGVECKSSVHLPTGAPLILMVEGAVAQPVLPNQYVAEKIPLTQSYGVELFYDYGTKAITPDLIFKAKQST